MDLRGRRRQTGETNLSCAATAGCGWMDGWWLLLQNLCIL